MSADQNPAQSTLQEGDDVVVVFPSGRQVEGRIEEMVRLGDVLYNIVVWVEQYSDTRMYAPGWVYAWNGAPEHV